MHAQNHNAYYGLVIVFFRAFDLIAVSSAQFGNLIGLLFGGELVANSI